MDRSLLLNNAGRNANATSDLNSCAHRRRLSPRGYQTAVNLRRETICSTMLTALFSLQYPLHPRTSHASLQVTYGDHGARPRSSHKPKTRWAVNSCKMNHKTRSRPTVRKGPDALRGRTFYSLRVHQGTPTTRYTTLIGSLPASEPPTEPCPLTEHHGSWIIGM